MVIIYRRRRTAADDFAEGFVTWLIFLFFLVSPFLVIFGSLHLSKDIIDKSGSLGMLISGIIGFILLILWVIGSWISTGTKELTNLFSVQWSLLSFLLGISGITISAYFLSVSDYLFCLPMLINGILLLLPLLTIVIQNVIAVSKKRKKPIDSQTNVQFLNPHLVRLENRRKKKPLLEDEEEFIEEIPFEEEDTSAIFCLTCGSKNLGDSGFCKECGAQLESK